MSYFKRAASGETGSLLTKELRRGIANFTPTHYGRGNWAPVFDGQTGLIYYWNTKTGETTSLGAPKPTERTGRATEMMQMGAIGFGVGLLISVFNKFVL